jgi:FKBP-type peptidyl-prolyl cis-trans isomerase FkpA
MCASIISDRRLCAIIAAAACHSYGARVTRVYLFSATIFLALAALLAAACADSPAAPSSSFAPFSQTDLVVGTGTAAATGNTLSVNYTGWLYDASQPNQKGPQFDSSIGRSAFSWTLGAGQVIRGWDQGLVGMKVGGVRRLVIPPSLAYGSSRSGPIPPNATLLFEIALLDVQ